MSANTPLISTGEGIYELAEKAEKVRANPKASWVDYVINSSDHLGLFEGDLSFPGKAVPSKLSAFLEFLESKGEIDVKLGNHTITRSEVGDKAEFSIESDTDACYKLTTSFPASRGKPNVKNAAAWIDLNTVKNSPHVTLVQGFLCHPCGTWPMRLITLNIWKLPNVLPRYKKGTSVLQPLLYTVFLKKPLRLTTGSIVKL